MGKTDEAALAQGGGTKITKKDLNRVFWTLQFWGLGTTINNVNAQAIGFLTAMRPVLKKLYQDRLKEERVRAMQRHLEYFLSQNTATGIILGITSALEETTAESEKDAVAAVKAGMMGPLAGIGDSVFKLTIQAIAGSIGAAYAINGNFLGVILMFVIYNAINIAIKYGGIMLGYKKGMEFVTSGEQGKMMTRIINLASMVGVIVLGALISSTVKFNLAYVIQVQETTVALKDLADNVMPNIMPLLITLGLYQLNKRISRKWLIVVIFAVLLGGMLLALGGVIA